MLTACAGVCFDHRTGESVAARSISRLSFCKGVLTKQNAFAASWEILPSEENRQTRGKTRNHLCFLAMHPVHNYEPCLRFDPCMLECSLAYVRSLAANRKKVTKRFSPMPNVCVHVVYMCVCVDGEEFMNAPCHHAHMQHLWRGEKARGVIYPLTSTHTLEGRSWLLFALARKETVVWWADLWTFVLFADNCIKMNNFVLFLSYLQTVQTTITTSLNNKTKQKKKQKYPSLSTDSSMICFVLSVNYK